MDININIRLEVVNILTIKYQDKHQDVLLNTP